jgi:hypothetical protein
LHDEIYEFMNLYLIQSGTYNFEDIEVGGACSAHGIGEKSVWWESPKERDHSEDGAVDGRM